MVVLHGAISSAWRLFYFYLRQGLLSTRLTLNLISSLRWPWTPISMSETWNYRWAPLQYLWSVLGQNPWLCVYETCTLTIELWLQPVFILFYLVFEIESLFVFLALRKLTMWTRVSLNLQRSACLFLPNTAIKGVCYHIWPPFLFLYFGAGTQELARNNHMMEHRAIAPVWELVF